MWENQRHTNIHGRFMPALFVSWQKQQFNTFTSLDQKVRPHREDADLTSAFDN